MTESAENRMWLAGPNQKTNVPINPPTKSQWARGEKREFSNGVAQWIREPRAEGRFVCDEGRAGWILGRSG